MTSCNDGVLISGYGEFAIRDGPSIVLRKAERCGGLIYTGELMEEIGETVPPPA
jgi:hypothetical protein